MPVADASLTAGFSLHTPAAVDSEAFADVWTAALLNYETKTGHDLRKSPFLDQLGDRTNSVEDIVSILKKNHHEFRAFRAGEAKIRAVLAPLVKLASAVGGTYGDSISVDGVPGGKIVFAAFDGLLNATKGVSKAYDALDSLLSELRIFLARLEVHLGSRSPPSAALGDVFVRTLVQLLDVFALVTRYLDEDAGRTSPLKKFVRRIRHRAKDYGGILLGRSEVQDAVVELDKLTSEEHLMTAAMTLRVTKDVAADIQALGSRIEKAGSKLESAQEAIHEISVVAKEAVIFHVDSEIRRWLNPPDPDQNQDQLRSLRQDGTCGWFFDSRFEKWKTGSGGIYWVYGNPGTGKSILCSSIIGDLKRLASETTAVAYFYFDFSTETKQSLAGLLSSLVFQLATQSQACHALLVEYREKDRSRLHPSKESLLGCFCGMLTLIPETFVIIDALEECPEASRRSDVLPFIENLGGLSLSSISKLRTLITSRPLYDIQKLLTPLATHSVSLDAEGGHTEDLERYISIELNSSAYSDWPVDLKLRAETTLNSKASGMFLWAHLQLEYLQSCALADIERALNDLPPSLDATYDRMLRLLLSNPHTAQRLKRAFECIAFANRPFSAGQLAETFMIDYAAIGGSPLILTESRPSDPAEFLRRLCPGFIRVATYPSWGSSAVQFAHFSVQEYLSSGRLSEPLSLFSLAAPSGHTTLSEICLATLIHQPRINSSESRPLLYHYAVEYLDRHLFFTALSETVERLLSRFLHPDNATFKNYVSAPRHPPQSLTPVAMASTSLYFAAYIGSSVTVKALLEEPKISINAIGGKYGTALCAAALRNHLDIVEILLEESAEIAIPCERRTPRFYVTDSADALCIPRSSDAVPGGLKASALHAAARGGSSEIIKTLLQRGIAVDSRDPAGCTPLHVAALYGKHEAVRTLVDHGALIDSRDKWGRTPLHLATSMDRDEDARTILALLEYRADIEAVDEEGQTPLHFAMQSRCDANARVLLEQGADIGARTNRMRTPLHALVQSATFAERRDRASKIRFLTVCGAAIDACDQEGLTPLHLAAQNGHSDTVCALLDNGADINRISNNGYSSLYLSVRAGHANVARDLLHSGASIDSRAVGGWTVIHAAAARYLQLGPAIMHRLGVDIYVNERTDRGETALSIAAAYGSTNVVRFLLNHGAHINMMDASGLRAIDCAALEGRDSVVRLLIERGADVHMLHGVHGTYVDIAQRACLADAVDRRGRPCHHRYALAAETMASLRSRKWGWLRNWHDEDRARRLLQEHPTFARGMRTMRRIRKARSFEMPWKIPPT